MKYHVQSIDALRGIFALLVMSYHCSYWLPLPLYDWLMSFLRLWGIYGVEGFFVISGIALSISTKYFQFNSLKGNYVFLVRRYSRIWPLYALLFILYIYPFDLPDRRLLVLSMLFGFVNPEKATLIGGWSIGVEFVFYFMFPLLALICRNDIWRAGIATILSAILLTWYSHVFSGVLPGTQNILYVNPVNHFFFFVAGYFFGVLYKHAISTPLLFTAKNQKLYFYCLLIFILMSIFGANSSQLELLTGYKRLILSLMVVVMIGALMYIKAPSRLAVFLGNISFAIYLIHPLIVFMLLPQIPLDSAWVKFITVFTLSVLLSYLSHRYFEIPAQQAIRRVMHA